MDTASCYPTNKIDLAGPESITEDNINAAFAELEQRSPNTSALDPEIEGDKIEADKVYNFHEFVQVENGVVPASFEDDVRVVVPASGDTNWDIDSILLAKGVSSV